MPYEYIEEKIKADDEDVDVLIVDGEAVTSLYVDGEKIQPFGIYAKTTSNSHTKLDSNNHLVYYPYQELRRQYATNIAHEYNDSFYDTYDTSTTVQIKQISFPTITSSIFNINCDEFKLLKKLNLQSVYLYQGYYHKSSDYYTMDSSFTNFKLVNSSNNRATILCIKFNKDGDSTASEGTLYGINTDGTIIPLTNENAGGYIDNVYNAYVRNENWSEDGNDYSIDAYCYAINQDGKIMIIHYVWLYTEGSKELVWNVGSFSNYTEAGLELRSRHRSLLEGINYFYDHDKLDSSGEQYRIAKYRSQRTFAFDYNYNESEARIENKFIFINPLFCKMDD